jgi:hypothetical protein
MAKHYDLVEHQFGPGETVYGVLKYYNNNEMTQEELNLARIYYLIENNEWVRAAGEKVQIPILPQYAKK